MDIKTLQVVVAVMTIIMFLYKKNYFSRWNRSSILEQKTSHFIDSYTYDYGPDDVASTSSRNIQVRSSECSGSTSPKYKRDPDIEIDNEDIGSYPIE